MVPQRTRGQLVFAGPCRTSDSGRCWRFWSGAQWMLVVRSSAPWQIYWGTGISRRLIVVRHLGMKLRCAGVLDAYFVFCTNAWKGLVEARIEYGEARMLVGAIVRLAEAEQAPNVHMMVGLGSFNVTDAMLNSTPKVQQRPPSHWQHCTSFFHSNSLPCTPTSYTRAFCSSTSKTCNRRHFWLTIWHSFLRPGVWRLNWRHLIIRYTG